MTTTVAFKVYYETAHVDSSQQIQFLLERQNEYFSNVISHYYGKERFLFKYNGK